MGVGELESMPFAALAACRLSRHLRPAATSLAEVGSVGRSTNDDVDRHQPLPGVLGLPGFLLGKLSPRGRRRFWVALGVVLVGAVAAAAILLPRISELKRERVADERREEVRYLRERRRTLKAEQRPRRGAARARGSAPVLKGLQAAIVDDVARRVRIGELETSVQRTECEALGGTIRNGRPLDSYSCTAVTSDLPEGPDVSGGGVIGYPYRAVADLRSGRFTFCKVSGRPGEGSYTRGAVVRLPRACGG